MTAKSGGSVYSVSQINAYIKNMFSQDFLLGRVWVKGEISNCKYHSSGHVYFTLKDEKAAISCVLFAGNRKNLAFRLENGIQVIVMGSVGTYEKSGTYQLYANEIRRDGTGILYERFEALKKELGEMGMFDPLYKQPIPSFVRKLGIVTAPTGAAVRDIIQISKRRSPGIEIFLYPAKVQGEGASSSISAGIRRLDREGLDVIIIGRGGGSYEDLWAFNEEETARAVFECRTPVVSAVGHETDTVITDFVADLRAPTPSAAAELTVPDIRGMMMTLDQYQERLENGVFSVLDGYRERINRAALSLRLYGPGQRVENMKNRHRSFEDALKNRMQNLLLEKRGRLALLSERLEGLSPTARLEQGYALVTDGVGKRLQSVHQTRKGERLKVYLSDGFLDVSVEDVWKQKQ